jgi:enamine deaminase RidA (YjgF/YER057c/UK114 family)
VNRTTINPWQWSVDLGFNQAELVQCGTDVLYLSGQSAMDASGNPQHAGDMAAQVTLALDNLEVVLTAADMGLSNIVRLNTYATDIDAMFANYGLVAGRLGRVGVQPPGSLLGVSQLAHPELMVEFEATAVR